MPKLLRVFMSFPDLPAAHHEIETTVKAGSFHVAAYRALKWARGLRDVKGKHLGSVKVVVTRV